MSTYEERVEVGMGFKSKILIVVIISSVVGLTVLAIFTAVNKKKQAQEEPQDASQDTSQDASQPKKTTQNILFNPDIQDTSDRLLTVDDIRAQVNSPFIEKFNNKYKKINHF